MKRAVVVLAVLSFARAHAQDAPAPSVTLPPAASTPSPDTAAEPSTPNAADAPETPASNAAPTPSDDDLNLEDIQQQTAKAALNTQTSVASSTTQRLRDSPGIVTVITRDEIVRLAPRDLIDLLHLVPGFSFGTDVQGGVGPIFRGIWGQEGKVLVLWDGFEINETMYLTAPIENHFPVAAIERVEVVRGPGSSLYGGFAELAVINIVSRNAAAQGVEGTVTYGQMWQGFGRANGELVYGQRLSGGLVDGLQLWANVFGGEAARSDKVYRDGYGSKSYRANWDNARESPTWLTAGASWRGLTVKLLVDLFRESERDHFDAALDAPINNSFYAAHVDVSYVLRLADIVEIVPRLNLKRQMPWFSGGTFLEYKEFEFTYYKTADRLRLQVPSRWYIYDGIVLTVGLDAYADLANAVLPASGKYIGLNTPFANGKASIAYYNAAAFAELSLNSEIVNVTAGARVEYHSAAGFSFVPRLALTKSFDRLWVKALLSGAFKPPGVENITLNPDIKPENATVYEGQLGYDVTETISVSASAFRIEVQRPIVYSFNSTKNVQEYANFSRTGSQGVELELKMLEAWGGLNASYSFVTNGGLNEVPLYDSGQDVLRAVPAHKLALSARFNATSHLSVAPTLVLISERYGWLGAANGKVEREPPAVLAGVAGVYRDVFFDGLDATLAVHNIFDTEYRYLQPYDGGHAPLPAGGRELLVRVAYRFGL